MGRWDFYDRFERFEPSVPRKAKGGIRAQSTRGSFGESWWAKRWMQVLESFQLGGRLQRGRRYARSGQVLSIAIAKGTVAAEVQGSRPDPYQVNMQVKTLASADWTKVAGAISGQALFAAKLLAGELPAEIEGVFQAEGLSLFPVRLSDLRTHCSCPDASNPCKHIAAVYCLLAEEFDRDPFLVFQLRGMTRDEFLGMIAQPVPPPAEEILPPEPLPDDTDRFWNRKPLRAGWLGEVQPPALPAALVRRLGHLPFWRSSENFRDAMQAIYVRASAITDEPPPAAAPRRSGT